MAWDLSIKRSTSSPDSLTHKPTYQLVSPRVTSQQLNDDALGRALDTLYAHGVTELYSLLAATAAERLGLAPRCIHLDTTSFHVDGRYNSDEEPGEQVVHITRGYSRDHRPDLNQVMLELMVEHQAGIPLLMQPLSGNSSDTQHFGEAVRLHVQQLQATYGLTYLVADSALYSEANLEKLAQTQMKWITRVPATLREVTSRLGPGRSTGHASRCRGLSRLRVAIDLRGRGATLGPHPLRAPPGSGTAHR